MHRTMDFLSKNLILVFIDKQTHSANYDPAIAQKMAYDNSMMNNNDEGTIDTESTVPKIFVATPLQIEQETVVKNPAIITRITIILAIVIGLLVVVVIGLTVGIVVLKGQMKEKMEKCLEEQMKNNNTIEYLTKLRVKDIATMEELTKTTKDLEEKSRSFTRSFFEIYH